MISAEKQRQRAFGKNARKGLSKQQRQAYSEAICRRVEVLAVFQKAETVLLYAAFGAEASLDALAQRHPEKKICYPVCLEQYEMIAARPWDESSWYIGEYGIRTPILERSDLLRPEQIELILVPCTAFDASCRRVGMGKGYYDRFLVKCVHAVKLGVAFECQRVEHAAVDEFDVRLDGYVTEKRTF